MFSLCLSIGAFIFRALEAIWLIEFTQEMLIGSEKRGHLNCGRVCRCSEFPPTTLRL